MDGYRVSARIDRATPRLARHGPERRATAGLAPEGPEPFDLVGRPLDDALLERWATFRERWSQTTFFLFDANSWR
jgi:hypothetical protein